MYGYDQKNTQRILEYANSALDLEHNIVAMKFLFTDKEFDNCDFELASGKMTYCTMVIRAGDGESMKADIDNFGCFGGARALGIVEDDQYYLDGRFFEPRGLYQDLATSRKVTDDICRCSHRVKGIMVGPLRDFKIAPDVVLIVSYPRNIMRLIQGYTYKFGTAEGIRMIGNQAICSEVTAHPFIENSMNIPRLCNGPRTAGMKDNEMALGIVFNKFEELIHGLCMTITAIEHNPRKEEIIENFKSNDIKDIPVKMGRNYGHPFFKRDFDYFKNCEKKNPRTNEELFLDIFEDEI